MKQKLEVITPMGIGTVQYGEFMPGDGRKKKYHCWWTGCGIGGDSNTLKCAEEYLIGWIKEYLANELNKLEEKTADIRMFLRNLTTKSPKSLAGKPVVRTIHSSA